MTGRANMPEYGPKLRFPEQLHATKYRQPGETFRDAMNRLSGAMADKDSAKHYHDLRDILLSMRFSPAGRIQSAMGAVRDVTAFNCYVSGIIPDSYVNTDNEYNSSIMHRALEAAATMRMGGGIGYDFSTLRPRGEMIRKLQSQATGPVSFMDIFNSVGRNTSSSGHRRGAQMGVLRIDHPDIREFINAKRDQDTLSAFNISVGVTDDFMEALKRGDKFDLTWGGEIYQTVWAGDLWESIMQSTWDWADPGVLFVDTVNNMNNLWYCEHIAATNPCGEQPLPPFGACLLGSYNLTKYISGHSEGGKTKYTFDYDMLTSDIAPVVRAMDNVIDRSIYPLPEQAMEARSKRRMGLGIMGLANAGETLGYPYGSRGFLNFERRVMTVIRDAAYRASIALAKEKGSFPMLDKENYLKSSFIQTLPEDIRADIKKHGIRNSHLLSVAPTGTISMCADNISSGHEPVFSRVTERQVYMPNSPPVQVSMEDYALANWGTEPRTTDQCTIKHHMDVHLIACELVDSAVSKTFNVTAEIGYEKFKNIYLDAWEGGAKGCTTFNIDGKKMALLKAGDAKGESCTYNPDTGERSCE